MFREKFPSVAQILALYVDPKVAVINKPPGLVSQTTRMRHLAPKVTEPSENELGRVLDGLKNKLDLPSRPLPVHRLDKSTTGVLLLARTPQAAKDLSRQFASRTVRKIYLALVRGGRKTFPTESGKINERIIIEDGRVSLSNRGREAHTTWEILDSSSSVPLSLLRLTLHTGLKHQLRIHLAQILKAPIIGDNRYCRSELSKKITSTISIPDNRLFLHASHISFVRYRAWGKAKQFRVGITAPLPKDFVDVCAQAGFSVDESALWGNVTIDGQPALDLSVIQGKWLGPRPP